MPFAFEGKRRKMQALESLEELKKSADAYIVISNDLLREVYGNLTLGEAFSNANAMMSEAVNTIMGIISARGSINVDFRDVRAVLKEAGLVKFSTSQFGTRDRARLATESSFSKPFLSPKEIENARYVLIKIASSDSNPVSMEEVNIITDAIQNEAGLTADLIWGDATDNGLGDHISISMIASGFEYESNISEVTETVNLLNKSLAPVSKNSISLYFLEDEYSPNEIVEVLSFLSDLYRSEGGDELVIKGSDVLQFESILSLAGRIVNGTYGGVPLFCC
ncbi:cell division GTPase FtsZ [Pedobacter africanus]